MKRSFKRAAAAVLALTVMCGSAPVMPGSQSLFSSSLTARAVVVDSGTCGDNLTWRLDDNGVLTIEGTGEMTSSPWRHDYAENFYKVVLPDGLTSICVLAFSGCANLTDINIPDSVTSIRNGAFENCESLISITLPPNVKRISNDILSGCSALKKVAIMNKDAVFDEPDDYYYFDNINWTISNNKKNIEKDGGDRVITNKPYFKGFIYGYAGSATEEFAKNYCQFVPITEGYSVVFLPSSGSGTMKPKQVSPGAEIILPKCEFSSPNMLYSFGGWKIGKEIKEPGDKIIVDSDMIIEATWKSAIPTPSNIVQRSALKINKGLIVELYADLGSDVSKAYLEGEDGVVCYSDLENKKVTEGENAGLYRLSYVTKPEHSGSPITLCLADKDGNFLTVTSTDSDVKAGTNSAAVTVDDYVKAHYSADDAKVPWLGDPMCDNVFSADDASYTLRLFSKLADGKSTPTAFEMSACDVNGDEKLSSDDASLILRYFSLVASGKDIDKYEYFKNPT